MNEQTISLDVTKRPAITPVLYIRQGDAHGTTLNAEMYDNGVALNLANYSVRFAMRTPNGSGYYEVDGSASGNVASFVIDETYAGSVSGVTDVAYVEVIDTDTAHTSSGSLRVVVLPSATEDTDPAGAYVNGVDRWLANAQQSLMNMENAANAEVDSAIDRLDDAVADVDGAVSRANAAAAAAEGVVVDAVPLMSKTVHGGAKLGHGLRVSAGALGVQLIDSRSGTGTVQADGDYLHALEVDGVSEQRTTTGKNLLKPRVYSGVINGITTTARDDGSIVLSGTASADSDFVIETESMNAIVVPAGNYTFSASGLTNGVKFIISGSGMNGFPYKELTSASTSATGSVSDGAQPFRYIQTRVASGTTVNTVIRPQLEAGSTATTYEPYTGGNASPSPDYPQEVRTVKGINLLDTINAFPKPTTTYQGCTITNNGDGTYTLSGTNSVGSPWGFNSSNGSLVLQAGTYTLSCSAVTGCSDLTIIASDGTTVARTYVGKSATFTLAAATEIVSWRLVVAASATIGGTFKCQLERGLTAHDYVPYGALGLKVTGKNRLDVSGYTDRWHYGITYENTSDGIKVYGKSTDTSFNITGLAQAGLSRLEPGTYTLSWEDVDNAGIAVSLRDGSANTILNYGASGRSFTIASTTDVYIIFYIPNNKTVDGVFRPQIERGTAATEYAPCVDSVVPIPLNGNALASLPYGTCDELAIDDAGHAVIEKKVETVAYSGDSSESWTSITSGLRVAITRQGIKRSAAAAAVANAACSHFTASSMNATSAGTIGLAVNSAADQIVITPTGETITVADWTAWLQSNPITLLYQLATPQTIDLGYIDMPRLTEGSTIELLASIDPPIDAEWWAVGAGAVHESNKAWGARVDAAVAELAEAIADL